MVYSTPPVMQTLKNINSIQVQVCQDPMLEFTTGEETSHEECTSTQPYDLWVSC